MAFQRRTWVVERVCWVIMGVLLAAALAGLLAAGPLSKTEAADEAGLVHVEYERFQRNLKSSILRISLSPDATSGRTAAIRMTGGLAADMKVEKIVPEPAEAKAAQDGIEFVFHIADTGQPAAVRFYLQPHKVGSLNGTVGVSGQQPVPFRSFVYP